MQYSVSELLLGRNERREFLAADYHRDSTPQARLWALANQNDRPIAEKQRQQHTNVDQCDSLDLDIDELVIKPWCARFCPRCYTYK